ncbi:exopolygalacturonase-like [Elaeis guineensis]|uniref:exopolygalacturonase-like n=1 Tax=Elaeis guineensis var. tenera TaxID=51953 RepID=UPI003C6CF101
MKPSDLPLKDTTAISGNGGRWAILSVLPLGELECRNWKRKPPPANVYYYPKPVQNNPPMKGLAPDAGQVAREYGGFLFAFSDAWKAACEFNGSASLAIPQGTFFVGPGTLKAPSSLNSFTRVGWLEFSHLDKLVVDGGGILDGQGAEAWNLTTCPGRKNCKNLPLSMRFCKISNAKIANLTLLDSKGFHMSIQRSSNVTIRNLNISAPENSHNTDGIHISGSNNIDLATLTIGTGDDCISIGQGNTNISISNVACGPGHGISIGSLGKYKNEKNVAGVNARNCTVSGTSNGIRIKTWPGAPPSEASDIIFEDIVIENVSNAIIIDQEYCPGHHCSNEPSGVKIRNVTYRRIRGTSNKAIAVNFISSQLVPCENVTLHDINLEFVSSSGSSGITSSHIQKNSSLVQNATSSCLNVKGMALGIQKPATCL